MKEQWKMDRLLVRSTSLHQRALRVFQKYQRCSRPENKANNWSSILKPMQNPKIKQQLKVPAKKGRLSPQKTLTFWTHLKNAAKSWPSTLKPLKNSMIKQQIKFLTKKCRLNPHKKAPKSFPRQKNKALSRPRNFLSPQNSMQSQTMPTPLLTKIKKTLSPPNRTRDWHQFWRAKHNSLKL